MENGSLIMKKYTLVFLGSQEINKEFDSLKEAKKYVEEARNEHYLNEEMYITNGSRILKKYPAVSLPDLDLSKMKMSLSQFADIINEADEWSNEFKKIIEYNGWKDTSGVDQWSICESATEKLNFDDNSQAVVLDK